MATDDYNIYLFRCNKINNNAWINLVNYHEWNIGNPVVYIPTWTSQKKNIAREEIYNCKENEA
jgi:hypothetical protein